MSERILVIGVGNPFRRDDGVGPAVVDLLRARLPAAELVTCDGEPTTLIELWTGARLAIVVDAVRAADGPAGRVHRLSADPPAATRSGIACTHAADLGDAVALAHALDRMPRSLLCYAVQIDDAGFGVGLSPAVAAAAQRLADEIVAVAADPTNAASEVP